MMRGAGRPSAFRPSIIATDLARGVVVQAEDHEVGLRHQFALGGRVLAPRRVDAEHLHRGHLGQPFADLQAGGAGLAINENLGHRTFSVGYGAALRPMMYGAWCPGGPRRGVSLAQGFVHGSMIQFMLRVSFGLLHRNRGLYMPTLPCPQGGRVVFDSFRERFS